MPRFNLQRLALFSRVFGRDESGAIAIMFGVILTVILTLTAGAIELHRRSAAGQELQNAADAAALAGKQRQVALRATLSPGLAKAGGALSAKMIFDQMMATSKSFNPAPNATFTWNNDGSLTVLTQPSYSVIFSSVLPASFSQLTVRSTANFAGGIPTEIAMVLDTTMSMFTKDGRAESRFTLMRNAAKRFTHEVFNAAQAANDPSLARISVVPWATTVNLRGGAPATADFTGDAPVVSMPDRGSRLPVSSPLGRGMVNNTNSAIFKPVEWRGCVSGDMETPNVYTDASQGSWNALVVKAPPIFNVTINEGPIVPTPVTTCTCTATENVPCTVVPGTQGFQDLIQRAIPQLKNARFVIDKSVDRQSAPAIEKAQCLNCIAQTCATANQNLPDCTTPSSSRQVQYCYYYGNGGRRNSFNPISFSCTVSWAGCFAPGTGPTADRTSPACVADPNEPSVANNTATWCPHYGDVISQTWDAPAEIAGPNLNCPSPMLGLSGNRGQVLEYIDRLSPVPGGTHADVGLRWGLRTLASQNNWPSFFGLTTPPAPWGTTAQKVMVLITDGENEQAVDFAGYWGCSRIDVDHDCTTSPNAATLDTRMLGWCDAIRTTYGVTIFAIAVNFSNTAAVSKLQACAGDPSKVFSVDASDLSSVLSGIASRVMAMRLTQ